MTSRCTIASPSPEPPSRSAPVGRQNRSNARARCSGAHPRPGVGHRELDARRAAPAGHPHRGPRRCATSSALLEQVVEHLLEAAGLGAHDEIRIELGDEVDARARPRAPTTRRPGSSTNGPRSTSTDGGALRSARASSSSPSTSRESRATSASEPLDVVARRVRRGVELTLEVLQPEPQRGERCAQLMRRVGDERLLRRHQLLEPPCGAVERLRELADLGWAVGYGRAASRSPCPSRAAARSRSSSGFVTWRARRRLTRNTMPRMTAPTAASTSHVRRMRASTNDVGYVTRNAPIGAFVVDDRDREVLQVWSSVSE